MDKFQVIYGVYYFYTNVLHFCPMKKDNFLHKGIAKNAEMIRTGYFENITLVDCECGCLVEGPGQPHETMY